MWRVLIWILDSIIKSHLFNMNVYYCLSEPVVELIAK